MNPSGRLIPSVWSLLLATAAIVVLAAFLVADHMTARAPDITNRATVREMLRSHGGLPIPLPVELPPGYEPPPPDFWESTTDAHGRVETRTVAFFPTEEAREDRQIAAVQMCVEAGTDEHGPCGFGASPVVHRVDDLRVMLWIPDHVPENRAAWRAVLFTTNLNEVRWLH